MNTVAVSGISQINRANTVLDSAFEHHKEMPLYTSPYDGLSTSLQRYACYNDTTERSPMGRRSPRLSVCYYVFPPSLLTGVLISP